MPSELTVISPIDGTALLHRSYASDAQIMATLTRARKAQRAWKYESLDTRCALLRKAVRDFVAHGPEIAEAITRQMGRPLRYTPGEVRGFEERAMYMLDAAAQALSPLKLPVRQGLTRFIAREPVGVVLTVAPWNYPLLTAVNSIVPALAAGNAVILKHSDQTPLCAEQMYRAFHEAGLPEGVFQFVHANHGTVARLVQAPEIDYVSFTGSVPGGEAIEAAAVGRFIGRGLELGGNDAAYVRADADLTQAVETIVDGAFFNAGQSCCGIQRVYVDHAIYDDFVDAAAALTHEYVLGDPMDPDTTLGPVVRNSAAQEIRGVIDAALRQGASNLIDGRRFAAAQEGTAYVAPALLVDVNHDMAVMNDECFGPVAGIMPVRGDAQAITLMNDSAYGLTGAVFTADADAAMRIGRELEVGTFFMNRCDYLDPALAWSGVKNTGHGVSLSALGYHALTQTKSFHLRTS
ncbi:aldehyde dehydrogenase family protein [Allopusillimonas ginsengisoli]|uniref:aldehyde dehydrogenase family protein n=1 Tax=Allopusillimonas ginsengisoli TaxID=453575 RepID=UPI00101FA652|nr:aldehyde dehydrogenase family protein [Allopusillimonas ginsengisoli]TEA77551.1 aldehyde dehydrogenase family protein [Allopusillimonas ginsengisoli]